MISGAVRILSLATGIAFSGSAFAGTIDLTRTNTLTVDVIAEAHGDSKGVVVSWDRIRPQDGQLDGIYVQRFSPAGKPLGKLLTVQSADLGFSDVEALPAGGDKVVTAWLRAGEGLVGRTGDLATGALGPIKVLVPKIAEAYSDVTRLSNGNVLAVTYAVRTDLKKTVHATLLSPTLKVLAGPTDIAKTGPMYFGTATPDFTVVSAGSGTALVIWRDRVDGNVYAVPLGASGKPAGAKRRINAKSMPLGSFGQNTVFSVTATQLKGGRIAVAWTRLVPGAVDDDAFDVQVRVLSRTGVPVSSERTVTATSKEEQLVPGLAALPDGRFTVTWTNNGGPVEGRPRSYWIRTYKADGSPANGPRMLFKGDRGYEGILGFGYSGARIAAAGTGLMHVRTYGDKAKILRAITARP